MRILIAHNRYQHAGGEDAVVQTESSLLRESGEDVRLYERSNMELDELAPLAKIGFICGMQWSKKAYQDIRRVIQEFKPDVVHVHNIFFMISPSIYSACRDEGVPVVQTLHNFRLLCANALFLRNNKVCEECVEHQSLWRGLKYSCYKNSWVLSALMIKLLTEHWKKRTWIDMIDMNIVIAEFVRQKFITAGIPARKISVKPNFFYADYIKDNHDRGFGLLAGRLSPEKGIETLIHAWQYMPDIPLKIVGSGPLLEKLKQMTIDLNIKNIEFLGFVPHKDYDEYMRGAKFLVVPSICYENFPRVIAEAYAYGIPVVASDLGTMREAVVDGKTGLLFKPGDPMDLRDKLRWCMEHPKELDVFRANARERYKNFYAPRKSYQRLMEIYRMAIENYKR